MENLSELTQYHFPNIPPERLNEETYRSYIRIYSSLSASFKFYRGFSKPDPILQAKIYRAVRLTYGSNHKEPSIDPSEARSGLSFAQLGSCIVFRSPHGLVVKVKEIYPEFDRLFDVYLSQPDSCVFLPPGYDRLDRYEFPYYHDLLLNFKKNLELDRTSALIRCSESNSEFLFLCLEEPTDLDLASEWRDYLQGGLKRKIRLSPGQIPEAFRRFRWTERVRAEIDEGRVVLTIRCSPLDEFKRRTEQIEEEDGWTLLDLGIPIENEQEAIGLLRKTKTRELIPLIGTTWCCLRSGLVEKVRASLTDWSQEEMPDGTEIFTQVEFSEMSVLQKSSLIRTPEGRLYSLLGLYEQIRGEMKTDPLTREAYSEEFLKKLEEEFEQIRGPFLEGFPPTPFDPQLITICPELDEASEDLVEPSISFYLQTIDHDKVDTHLFWKIPDLRRTEYASLTLEAIRILVLRWSDRSLFKGYRPERLMNPNLIFSPSAYYVFEKNAQEIDLGRFPTERRDQADRLREQIYILQTRV